MTDNQYRVLWSQYARVALAEMEKFKIDPLKVFKRSKLLLSKGPEYEAYGYADFPGFEFNGYFWTLINNVVVVYQIFEKDVLVDACFFANTGKSAHIFWGIEPEDE